MFSTMGSLLIPEETALEQVSGLAANSSASFSGYLDSNPGSFSQSRVLLTQALGSHSDAGITGLLPPMSETQIEFPGPNFIPLPPPPRAVVDIRVNQQMGGPILVTDIPELRKPLGWTDLHPGTLRSAYTKKERSTVIQETCKI